MKIAYLFTSGRKNRIALAKNGQQIPYEFFLGANELRDIGHFVDLYELEDFNPERKIAGLRNKLYKFSALNSCGNILGSEKSEKLNGYDLVIAANEYIAFGLYDLYKRKVLKKPFTFFVMGMLSRVKMLKQANFSIKYSFKFLFSKYLYHKLIKHSLCSFFLGEGEFDIANELYPNFHKKLFFLPFPIDTNFWTPIGKSTFHDEYILFIGNDLRRDYGLLLNIAKALPEQQFIFITSMLENISTPSNVKLIKGDWRQNILSDELIRTYIGSCSMVIIPLKDSFQPSGQSVAQQAMACKKVVLISATPGFWDSKKIKNNEHLILINSSRPASWVDKILALLKNKAKTEIIGENARMLLEKEFSLSSFAKKLEIIIKKELAFYQQKK